MTGGFFDTELLLLAEYNGLRVQEIPVDWVEDLDSRVRVLPTVMADVRGLARVARAKVTGAARVAELPRRPEPRCAHPNAVVPARGGGLGWQLAAFGLIGLLSTVATVVLYALLRSWSPPLVANLAALMIMSVLNTEANRRLTFSGRSGSRQRVHLQCLGVLVTNPSRWLEITVLLIASAAGTAARFLLLRTWIFPT